MTRSAWWKLFGLAGVVGVVTTGAVIARAERRRRAYTPEEIRTRLRDRLAETSGASGGPAHGRSGEENPGPR